MKNREQMERADTTASTNWYTVVALVCRFTAGVSSASCRKPRFYWAPKQRREPVE